MINELQELQQEVNSLLLFRQAVLAALPHLNQQSNSTAPGQALAAVKSNQTWTRRKHLQQQQYSSLNAPAEPTTAQSTTAHHQVVDSGFSTEASNASNTSPRSSRFDAGDVTMAQQPGDKELVQHLERIQQRLVRLKKDEDRLLALLNPNKKPVHVHVQPKPKPPRADDQDELWRLLDEIELRSHALRDDAQSGKKRVSFQLVDAGTWTEDEALDQQLAEPSGSVKLDRDQVAAVLRLASPVQLQKQLLCALLDNKVSACATWQRARDPLFFPRRTVALYLFLLLSLLLLFFLIFHFFKRLTTRGTVIPARFFKFKVLSGNAGLQRRFVIRQYGHVTLIT